MKTNQLTNRVIDPSVQGRLMLTVLLLCGEAIGLIQAQDPAVRATEPDAAGEHATTPADAAEMERRFSDLFAAALRAATNLHPDVTFWADETTLGGQVIRCGRFREFYISETASGRTLWFRDTSGPGQEYPRNRMTFRFRGSDGSAAVSQGVYLAEGQPLHAPASAAMISLRETCDFWVSVFRETGPPRLADARE